MQRINLELDHRHGHLRGGANDVIVQVGNLGVAINEPKVVEQNLKLSVV